MSNDIENQLQSFGLSCVEITRLKKEYNLSDESLLKYAKSTYSNGRKCCSIEYRIKADLANKYLHKLDFKKQDNINKDIYNKHGNMSKFNDIQYLLDNGVEVEDALSSSELFKYKNLRCTGATYLDVKSLGDLSKCPYYVCVRYDNVPYYISSESFHNVFKEATYIRDANEKVASGEKLDDVYDSKINSGVVFQRYFSNVIRDDYQVYNRIINFGSWLLSYLRENYCISSSKSCILLEKSTNIAHIFLNEYVFRDFLNSRYNFEIDKNALRSKPKQYGDEFFSYWLKECNVLNDFIILND